MELRLSDLRPLDWLRARDPDLAALRRAARGAVVMPALFAVGEKVVGKPDVALFAAFGSFAMLVLVDFAGPMRDRLRAQAAFAVAGGLAVCFGTLASREPWLAALAMALVGFGVLFAGILSSVLAGATTALLLSFILPVSIPGPVASIPGRLAGWGMASGAALFAAALLWPRPARDPLRSSAIATCRALAARLRSDVASLLRDELRPSSAEHDVAVARANMAVADLQRTFLATPYRPSGLSTAARMLVGLLDELSWVNAIILQSMSPPKGKPANRAVCAVKSAAASVLDRGADLLERPGSSPEELLTVLAELRNAFTETEHSATRELPIARSAAVDDSAAAQEQISEFITSLDPSFRAQELSFAVSQIAVSIELIGAAERRSWLERLLGRQPAGVGGTLSAARKRLAVHLERHSVWLHNSVRGSVGLSLAILVASLTGVQHSFWVVLGMLSVLRSNALNTGQSVVRALLGTSAGVIVGAVLLGLIGGNTTLLWFLLPPAILLAGFAPAAISFIVGQAAFTVTLVILFNILQPAGWRVGLLRVEDIALGGGVSLLVGLLFWPRGAAPALGHALAEAYAGSVHYLVAAVRFGMGRCGRGAPSDPTPTYEAGQAAATAGRLDDAFRSYLAERGPKPAPLAEVTTLLTGAAALRLAADAVLDLWQRDDGTADGDRATARQELLASTELAAAWYDRFAASLIGLGEMPEPLAHDKLADRRLIDAVRHDLQGEDGQATATAVRMIWTGDHLDAARRLQGSLVGPARAISRPRSPIPLRTTHRGGPRQSRHLQRRN
jgi:uncharacterized membrane protein YccC